MRFWTLSTTQSLTTAIAIALSAGQAVSDEHAYSSVRDCMREVTKVESQVKEEDVTSTGADSRLFDQARDLCMQTRYEMVTDILGKVTPEGGP